MKLPSTSLVAVVILSAASILYEVHATPVVDVARCLVGPMREVTCVDGIQGLNVNGIYYNVDFVDGSTSSIFGDPANTDYSTIPFWGDSAAAFSAAQALFDVFTANAIEAVLTDNTGIGWGGAHVNYEYIAGSVINWTVLAVVGGNNVSPGSNSPSTRASYAVFTNAVPEPASLALVCLALAGLGLSRRRQ